MTHAASTLSQAAQAISSDFSRESIAQWPRNPAATQTRFSMMLGSGLGSGSADRLIHEDLLRRLTP